MARVRWVGRRQGWLGRWMVVAAVCVGAGSVEAGQVRALRGTGDDPLPTTDCLGDVNGTISTTTPSVVLGQSTTLRWSIQTPAGCGVTVQINGVARTGTSLTVTPNQPTTYTLRVVRGGAGRTLGSTTLGVSLPTDASGRVVLVVDSTAKQWAFLEAIGRRNALVYVQNHVELNLSGLDSIHIAPGVSITGCT